jgi:CPA1 family monovalent cation:H+ antiporter
LDELETEEWSIQEQVARLRVHYGRRQQRYANSSPVDSDCTVEAAESFRRLRQETLTAERMAAIGLRNEGRISDEVLHRIEHELDVEALRLGLGEHKSAVPLSPNRERQAK